MNYMRALWMSIIAYALTFIFGIVLTAALGYDPVSGDIPMVMWWSTLLVSVLIVLFCTMWYFQAESVVPSLVSGAKFGLIVLVLGTILDVVIMFASSGFSEATVNIGGYYTHPMFFLTSLSIITVAAFVGYALEKDL